MRSSRSTWWHTGGTQSQRLLAPVILLTLATVGTVIYLVPGDSGPAGRAAAAEPRSPGASRLVPSSVVPSPSTSTTPSPTLTSPTGSQTGTRTASNPGVGGGVPQVVHQVVTRTSVAPGSRSTVTRTAEPRVKVLHCWDFKWQQDAQAVYVQNLSDPWALDGAAGPNNGDGLACSTLPVDPNRSPSTPIAAYQPPVATAAAKSALLSPTARYWGVTENGLPRATHQYNRIATEVDKAPSSIGFFSTWDKPYPAAQVEATWQKGALPVITWMSTTSDGSDTSTYSLTNIINGTWDSYLYKFAGDVVRQNLPVVLRFDHEMNGSWYPWSAGRTQWNNSPAKYIAMWRHVWNIFEQVGANDDVIWLFSPGRVDNIGTTGGTSKIADDYPGDEYVDWVGATVYWRNGTQATDYNTSFGRTVTQLREITDKPLFFAEIGALQTYRGADVTAGKQTWIEQTLKGFLEDPTVVGFSWFNNVATTSDDPTTPHDWRFDASDATLGTFKTLVADAQFASGTMPDATRS
jgi:hypothetical protein